MTKQLYLQLGVCFPAVAGNLWPSARHTAFYGDRSYFQGSHAEARMRATHYIVDCEGKALRSPFQHLRNALCSSASEHALLTHAVEKLGYVHVQEWPQGLVVLYCRAAISPVTLAGAIFLLSDLAEKRVTLSIVDRQVSFSLFRSRSLAIAELVCEMGVLEGAGRRPDRRVPGLDAQRFRARRSAT